MVYVEVPRMHPTSAEPVHLSGPLAVIYEEMRATIMTMATEFEDLEQAIVEAEEALVAKLETLGMPSRICWALIITEHTEWLRRTGRNGRDDESLKDHNETCRAWTAFVRQTTDSIKQAERERSQLHPASFPEMY